MAASKTLSKVQIRLAFEVGTTESGAAKYQKRTLSAINPAITDDNLYACGEGIGTLSSEALNGIERIDTYDVISE